MLSASQFNPIIRLYNFCNVIKKQKHKNLKTKKQSLHLQTTPDDGQ